MITYCGGQRTDDQLSWHPTSADCEPVEAVEVAGPKYAQQQTPEKSSVQFQVHLERRRGCSLLAIVQKTPLTCREQKP
jgi:hypothetical protein